MSRTLTIDGRMLKTGIGAYSLNLIRELHDSYGWHPHAVTHPDYQSLLTPYCERVATTRARMYSLQEQISVPLAASGAPVLHVPHFNAPLLYRGSLLITIHDLTHLLFPAYRAQWKSRLYAAPMLSAAARQAEHIFTVSEYSKSKIIETLGVAEDKITVTYNGVSELFCPGDRREARATVAARFGQHAPYLLFVGSPKPHKNLDALLAAYASLFRDRQQQCGLVIVGSDAAGTHRIRTAAENLAISPLFIENATNPEVVQLYRAAELSVLPSFEEGFGLPILESMACDTPVLSSTAASLPEIAGDAALYFDPNRPEELAAQIDRVLSSSDLQLKMRHDGLARAASFSWKEMARRHIEVYERYCNA
ncbi:MAG TPA: glycosyltransferase family 1 protein [Granulicella sp.]|nr:glycosyltransferase family 1 protein [Granulicella sp.]